MIQMKGIKKNYGKKKVLKGIDLTVTEGECLGIIGPNGSGKSTLLSIMVGALKPTEGSKDIQGEIGYVPQDNALMEELTVKDNLEFWAAAHNKSLEEVLHTGYIDEVLGIKEMLYERVKNLSGGMKKRVNIGIALIGDPRYIVLDEPCSALDIIYKNEVVNYLLELKQKGKTIIYTSHCGDEIEKICDKVCILKEGTIIKEAKLEQLKAEYHDYDTFDEMVYRLLV